MNEYRSFYIRIIKQHLISILIACAGATFFRQVNFAIGLLFGGILSILLFRMLYMQVGAVPHLKGQTKKKVFTLFFAKYIVSYLIIAVFLFLAIRKDLWTFVGMSLGLLGIKMQLFLSGGSKAVASR